MSENEDYNLAMRDLYEEGREPSGIYNTDELHAFRDTEDERREVLQMRARLLAQPASISTLRDTNTSRSVVAFQAGESVYGVYLHALREIREVNHLAVMPCTPKFIQGLLQVHGEIAVVIDLVEFFGLRRSAPLSIPMTVLVLEVKDNLLGIACDSLRDVQEVNDGDILPVPAAVNRTEREIAAGLGEDRMLILDADVLIGHPRLRVGQG